MAADNRNFVNTFANDGGADVLVEDKRMNELKDATPQTSSQISTSAQYIPLQDTDGNLVKINPASFEEAVRNVLGTLLANNDKGTTISAVPALSGSGASLDFGSVSAANLASVLGAFGSDINSLTVPANTIYNGKFFCRALNLETYNLPGGYGGLFAISVKDSNNGCSSIQFFTGFATDSGKVWVRDGYSGTGFENTQWSSWRQI